MPLQVLPLQMQPVQEVRAKPTLLEMVAPIQIHLGVKGNWFECIAEAEKMLSLSPVTDDLQDRARAVLEKMGVDVSA